MNFCGIVFGLLTCVLNPGVKPTPAEAVAILAPYQYHAVVWSPPLGARAIVVPSQAGQGPFGPYPPPPAMRPLNCCGVYVNETLWPYPYPYPVRPVTRPSNRR